jgi:hypothetical protein
MQFLGLILVSKQLNNNNIIKEFIMKKIIAVILLSLFSIVSYANAQLDNEISTYTATFNNGSYAEIKAVLGEFKWKGITDEGLYDALLKQFHHYKDDVSKLGVKNTAYISYGLASSGNDKYKEIIQNELDATRSKHLRKYYKKAIGQFALFARINPIISQGLEQAEDVEAQRVKNMLTASEADIVVIGAKRVYHSFHANSEMLAITERRLLELYPQARERDDIQASAYLAKALAKSGVVEYRELLRTILKDAPSKKLRSYVKKYLRSM